MDFLVANTEAIVFYVVAALTVAGGMVWFFKRKDWL